MYEVYLKENKEKRILNGYKRIYANEVAKICGKDINGSIVKVFTNKNKFVATGYINHLSKILVRVLSLKDEIIDESFFKDKISRAYLERQILKASSYRLFFGESDGIPGLIIDKYEDYLVIQILSLGIEKFRDLIKKVLIDLFNPKGIYERSDQQSRLKEGLSLVNDYFYNEFNPLVIINENGLKLEVDLKNGQKTGYFLDQRENRFNIRKYVENRTVLDCFANVGGFGINALKGNAKFVTLLDISEKAINCINKNMELNNFSNYEAINCDCFLKLREFHKEKRKFDFIVLDPPAFTKNVDTVKDAYRGYLDINTLALKLLNSNSYMLTCSCSLHMHLNLFIEMVKEAARHSNSIIKLKEINIQSRDHSIDIENDEALYLKALIIYKV